MRKDNFDIGEITELPSGRHFSAAEIQFAVDQASSRLKAAGVGPQKTVVLADKNSASFFVHLLACWDLEACVIPLDPGAPPAQQKSLLTTLSPHLIIDDQGRIQAGPGSTLNPPETRLGLLTSGSTGLPKVIWHSKSAVQAKFHALRQAIPSDEIGRTLCFLPTFFGHGLFCNSLFPLLSGRHLYIAQSFGISLISELNSLIHKYDIRFFSSTPPVWNMIEQFSPPANKLSLKRVHCASAPLDHHRAKVMQDWSPTSRFWNVYGLTEFLGWVSAAPVDGLREPGCIGRGWDCQMQLDARTNEVLLQAPYQMMGSSGWFNSRDIGAIDSRGEIILKGRADFLINKGGLKIQPEEVELVASEFNKVSAACCFAMPDSFVGNKVGLALVPKNIDKFDSSDIEEMRRWLATRLPAYKVPDMFYLLPSLPQTNRGKTDRRAVAALVLHP